MVHSVLGPTVRAILQTLIIAIVATTGVMAMGPVAQAESPVYLARCGFPENGVDIKPRAWSWYCTSRNPSITRLSWRNWGTSVAVGRGTDVGTSTTPRRASLRVSRIRRCPSPRGTVRQYTRAQVTIGRRVLRYKLACSL